MAKTASKTDGLAPDSRLTTAEAYRLIGCSRSAFQRYVARGLVAYETDDNGQHWYVLSDVEKLRDSGAFTVSEDVNVSLLEKLNDFCDTLATHTRASFDRLDKPAQEILKVLLEENKELRARTKQQDEHIKQLQEQTHERHKELIEIANTQELRKEALGIAKSVAQPLAMQIAEAVTGKRPGLVTQFLSTLKKDQLLVILNSGLLEPNQLAILQALIKEAGINLEEPASANNSETETTESAVQ